MSDAELSEENYDEILPAANIFESRIDDIWNSKMQGYEELLNKDKEEEEEVSIIDPVEELARKAVEYKENKKKKTTNGSKKGMSPRKKFIEDVFEVTPKPVKDIASIENALLPASARKRLKLLRFETEHDKRRVEAETEQMLSSCEAIQNSEEDDVQLLNDDALIEQEIILRIRYLSKTSRIRVKLGEAFKSIFEEVADIFKLKASEILLCLGERNIEYSDTPLGLKLKYFDVIDCIPYKPDEQENEYNSNKLLLKIQSNDTRKKFEMYIHKLEKFEELMKRYAELRNLSLKNLEFEFDGEKIEGTETPVDLDMESGSCIDVRVLNYKERKKPIVKLNVGRMLTPEEILDICVLD